MSKKGGFLLGAVIGGTAAAVAALLLAPESGKNLRNKLAKQADDLLDKLLIMVIWLKIKVPI